MASESPPTDLHGRLNELLEKNHNKNKPWLGWPTTWEELRLSHDQSILREYLTSPDIHREKLEEVRRQFLRVVSENGLAKPGAAVFLEGGTTDEWMLYSSDCNKAAFRQEAFFQHLVGVNEPDIYAAFVLNSHELLLFIPKIPADALRFMGPSKDADFYRSRYAVTDAIAVEAISDVEAELQRRGVRTVHVLKGVNSDSGRPVAPPKALNSFSSFTVDCSALYDILVECRLRKTPLEAEYLAAACLCSSQAHCFVARNIRSGMVEGQAEAIFKAYVGFVGGARHVAYDCICCAGENASILHYGHAGRPNDGSIKDNDLLLFDMGGDYNGYATDITFTYPSNGIFTETQKAIYDAVLDAQKSVIERMRPGVEWTELHRLAELVILKHLKSLRILAGSIEDCVAANLGSIFMPHGLGHFMGMDTHDVGGFTPSSPPSDLPGLRYLRTTRTLEEGMCITVEPGCYFVDHLLKQAAKNASQAHLLDFAVIEKYKFVGGVRLEDDVLITRNGVRNLTVVPRSVSEVEELLRLRV
ncbi:prolidase, putative [Eimeria tenella]|uniref:Xaa-Pro dipeptidase n=1 Tax=Eimeria tenella TaxID=5802 RepID=U6L1Y5_EIMTE|nr:prolidase, putative [Eimeria tenella]CDJ42604.1 prolidase, putative [Eimeria tenella]|eukprot:XP_013233354.1 prolidase, putative [Eimeria tenella]